MQCHKWLVPELLEPVRYLAQFHKSSILGLHLQVRYLVQCHKSLAQALLEPVQYRASFHRSSIRELDALAPLLAQILLQQFQPTQFPKLALQLPGLKRLRFLQSLYLQYNCE